MFIYLFIFCPQFIPLSHYAHFCSAIHYDKNKWTLNRVHLPYIFLSWDILYHNVPSEVIFVCIFAFVLKHLKQRLFELELIGNCL
jgi:hypothetical protein